MRILKIVNSVDSGGVFNCEKQFIKELLRLGIEVDLVIVGNGINKDIYANLGANFFIIPEIPSFSARSITEIFRVYKLGLSSRNLIINKFGDQSYDAIIYRRQYYTFLSYFIGKHFKSKVYWHIPGVIKSKFLKKVYNVLLSSLNVIPLANSKYTQSTLGDICKYVVYPGFDEDRNL
ncbi:hypothetical protein ACFX5U_20880 [Sphingobacterium sp. SG20118]|uniref:hypothetical protein n=1 Tax=Sphingobacterium sp. SG20118 TaxID=3367156 RepID=UPI0037DFC8F8